MPSDAPGRILIADDDGTVCDIFTAMLETVGYDVECVHNGCEAVEHCDANLPDLLICDLVMPVMGGLEAIRIIRSRHPELPILCVSGGDGGGPDGLLATALRSGATRTLAKPVDMKVLLKEVASLLQTGMK